MKPLGLTVWTLTAFWLWLGLTVVLRRSRMPGPSVGAAILSWIVTGLSLPWVMSAAERSARLWPALTRWMSVLR